MINGIKIDAHRLTVEIEIDNKDASDNNISTGIALNIMDRLLGEWIEEDIIKGVYDLNGNIKTKDWIKVDEWTIPPKVT